MQRAATHKNVADRQMHTNAHTYTHTGKQGMGTRLSDLENFSQFLRLFHGSIDSHIHPHTHTLMHKHTHTHTHTHTTHTHTHTQKHMS